MAVAKGKRGKAATAQTSLLDDVEKVGEALVDRVKHGLSVLTERVADTAKTTVETASSVSEQVADSAAGRQVSELMDTVEKVGGEILEEIGHRINALKERVTATTPKRKAKAKSKAKTKKPAKKKPTKKAAAKKAVSKKKATAQKKVMAKKIATKKKSVAKKSGKKKVSAKKKTSGKKRVTKRR